MKKSTDSRLKAEQATLMRGTEGRGWLSGAGTGAVEGLVCLVSVAEGVLSWPCPLLTLSHFCEKMLIRL